MGFSGGNAEDLEKTAKEMRNIEQKLADIYANETELTKEEALELMKKDEMLNVDFLKEKGFVNEIIEFKAVANFNNNNKQKMSNTLTKKEAEGLFSKFEKSLKSFFNPNGLKNKLVQDSTGTEIDFVDLAEDDEIVVGEKANIDGSPANGEYVMPDEKTYVFTDGTLTEIKEVEDMEALKQENETLKEEIETLKAEKETFENKFKKLEEDFTSIKNKITSNFEAKKKTKEEEGTKSKSRSLRNKK